MGMESVKLSKPWLDHAAKETVQVDPERAVWLRENGYVAAGSVLKMGEVDLTPHVVRAELVLRPVEPELQSPFPGVEITPPEVPDDGHIVSRSKRKSLLKELSEPLTLDVDVKEP